MADVTSITSGSLIAAEKVNGTSVYNTAGDKLGSIDDIMLDKNSGRAIYAVMSFGGFLGMGEKFHPLPWSTTISTTLPAVSANIMAQSDGSRITCTITVDGVVRDQHDSDGHNAQTFCLVKSA